MPMKFAMQIRRTGPGKRCGGLPERVRPLRRSRLEVLESRWVQASLPFGAEPNDTAEFMLGRVAVTPVLLESNGQIDASTENWNPAHIDQVLKNLSEGLDWWEQLLATKSTVHTLDFVIDRTYADQPVPTAYEPINRISNDYTLWTKEFLTRIGYTQSSSLEENLRSFNKTQRQKASADWSFTIFIVDSENEHDGTFAQGGSFSRAFAFAGGLFFVVPSTRPASTFAHETGHMFWARDEYIGGGSYYLQRGYYDTQNLNAIDNNPTPNFQQAPSIMSSGAAMDTAYNQSISPAATLAMVGWQDTDGDGIFDVLDVPLQLEGVGRVDVTTGSYRFTGRATAQALPNRNSSGLGNDITLNKVSRIEARFSGGAWQTVLQPDAYDTALNFSIPLAGQQSGSLQLRAVDDVTGIASNVFEGAIGALPDATSVGGIDGFVWNDANANGLFDAVESGLGAQQVRLVDDKGQLLTIQKGIEPDEKLPGIIAGSAYSGVALSAYGSDTNGNVGVFSDASASTGARVFRPYSINQSSFADTWNDRRQLKIEFASPTSFVSVDVIGAGLGSYGRLELYNASGQLLDRVTTVALAAGQTQTLELGRPTADVAYALVRGHMGTGIKIDNLHYGPSAQATTDASGHYSFPYLPGGSYRVQVVLTSATSRVTSTGGDERQVNLQPSASAPHIDFGVNHQNSPWHNVDLAEDVNDDGFVSAIDVLLVINVLNQYNVAAPLIGSALPYSTYVDVSNDGFVTALDALLVINVINSYSSSSAANSSIAASSVSTDSSDSTTTSSNTASAAPGEGEFAADGSPAPADDLLETLALERERHRVLSLAVPRR